MGCFTVILKPLGSLSTILITRLLITIMIIDQDTDFKYFCDRHCNITGRWPSTVLTHILLWDQGHPWHANEGHLCAALDNPRFQSICVQIRLNSPWVSEPLQAGRIKIITYYIYIKLTPPRKYAKAPVLVMAPVLVLTFSNSSKQVGKDCVTAILTESGNLH